jgi:hypothetical protein
MILTMAGLLIRPGIPSLQTNDVEIFSWTSEALMGPVLGHPGFARCKRERRTSDRVGHARDEFAFEPGL